MEFAALFYQDIMNAAVHTDGDNTLIHLGKSFQANLDVLDWLQSWQTDAAFYFRDKHRGYVLAGLESACNFEGVSAPELIAGINRLGQIDPDIFVCGGCGFFSEATRAPEWQGFKRFHFMLPRVALKQQHGQMRIAVNYASTAHPSPQSARRHLLEALERLDARRQPAVRHRENPEILGHAWFPDRTQWVDIIQRALMEIHQGHISKVVLARKEILRASQNWDARVILNQLDRIEEDSFLFLYQIGPHQAFLGRSPERLFCIRDQVVTTEAIAGTRPRGVRTCDDQRLTAELLGSPKELEEHRIVARYIQQHLQPFCRSLDRQVHEQPFKLKNLQHILTRFGGELKNGAHPLELLLALHPTPAVGGHPTSMALPLIQLMEPFERGWYAAPIGWMSRQAADFAVGIRSALVHGPELHLFAGTGIVDRSEPLSEWQETRNKLRNFSMITGLAR